MNGGNLANGLTGGLTRFSAAMAIPGPPAASSSPTYRARVLHAYEGIRGHTGVRCTTDGCRSAWYSPRHYPDDAAPSRATDAAGPGLP